MRRAIAFDMDGQAQFLGGSFSGGNQIKVVLDLFDGGHEDAEPPVAGFNRYCGADRAAQFADDLLVPGLAGFGGGEACRLRGMLRRFRGRTIRRRM